MIGAERLVFNFSLVLMVVFISAILIASKGLGIEVVECIPAETTFTEGKVNKLDEHTYQVYYVAGMWSFQPQVVEIPLMSDVDIYLTSKDVVHGLHINEKNVNMMAIPGAINATRVRFTKRGEYKVVCHEYCGVAHQNMVSTIIVK